MSAESAAAAAALRVVQYAMTAVTTTPTAAAMALSAVQSSVFMVPDRSSSGGRHPVEYPDRDMIGVLVGSRIPLSPVLRGTQSAGNRVWSPGT